MRQYGVRGGIWKWRAAYNDVKDGFFPTLGDISTSLSHGELHVLYLISLFTTIGPLFLPVEYRPYAYGGVSIIFVRDAGRHKTAYDRCAPYPKTQNKNCQVPSETKSHP